MALRKDFTKNEKVYVDAYIRVDVLQQSKIGSNRVEVTIYTDNTCSRVIDTMVCSCDFDYESERNYTEQAYDYLKTLDCFEGAEDC